MRKAILYSLMLFSGLLWAQEQEKPKDKDLPKGNDAFQAKDYAEAEARYRVSKSKNPEKSVAAYNLGNAIYQQKQAAESKGAYLKAIETAKTHPQKHRAYHNLGNAFMKEKNYSGAVEAYKNALRNNPEDEETRYNYALARKFLKDNPPPKDKDKKDKKDKQDEKKEKKDDKKDENKEGDKDKKQEPKNPDKPKDEGQPKPKPGGISKERLQNLLDAVNNEEKKVQEKVNARKVKGRPVQPEKDW